MNLEQFVLLLKNKDYSALNKLAPNYIDGNELIILDDAKLYFKPKQENTYSHLMEVFISKFLSQQFEVARSEYAILNGVEGSVSYDVTNSHWRMFNYDAFLKSCLNDYISILPFYKKTSLNFLKELLTQRVNRNQLSNSNAKELINQFIERMIVTNVFMNTDDHSSNLTLLTNETEFRFAPLFDNGSFLLGSTSKDFLKILINSNTLIDQTKKFQTYATVDGDIEHFKNANLNLEQIKKEYPLEFEHTLNKIKQLNVNTVLAEMKQQLPLDNNFVSLIKTLCRVRIDFVLQKDSFDKNKSLTTIFKEEEKNYEY